MPNPPINISSLDFDSIKTSLKQYLSAVKNTDGTLAFSGYDFEGSGMDTLLGILAYNTLYYSFYSNMIANETYLDTAQLENNIVSLVKPLGYLVGGKSCSTSEITAKSVASTYTLTAYTGYLSGSSSSGTVYRYYPVQDVNLTSGASTTFTVYEAKTVVNGLQVSVDTTEQKAFLGTTDIDLNTLTVKVNGTTWTKYNNYEVIPSSTSQVYFIDRTSNGFYLLFGKKTLNDVQSTFGKTIEANDVVTVSYLIPTGTSANNISSLTNGSLTVSSAKTTAGGTNAPDLDLVKFFAPKLFAANDRAVTKQDFYGLLLSGNVLPSDISSLDKLNIWGGEEANPPSFGRVFVSFANTSLNTTSPEVKRSISYLKNKCVVSILPEYIQAQSFKVQLNVSIFGSAASITVAAVKAFLENAYNTGYFNNSVIYADVKSKIISAYSVSNVSVTDASLSLDVSGTGSKTVYYKNEIRIPTSTNTVSSTSFTYKGNTVTIVNIPNDSTQSLVVKNVSTGATGDAVGTVDYTNGIIKINSNVIPSASTVTITVNLQYPDNIFVNNEYITTLTATVSKG